MDTNDAEEWTGGLEEDYSAPVVMVAGPFGSGMEDLAAMLAERLKVPLYDPHKLDELASNREDHEGAWYHLKEGLSSFFEYWVGHLHDRPGTSWSEHVYYLRETLRGVALDGGVVVGVCTHGLLPSEHLFRIHVEATPSFCARRLAESRRCDEKEAFAAYYHMEEERKRFLHDIMEDFVADEIPYDLVLNAETMTPQQMLEECMAAMTAKHFLEKAA